MKNQASSDNPSSSKPKSGNHPMLHPPDDSSGLDNLTQLFDSAPVGLCLLDAELRFLRVNDYLAKINGLPIDAHIGKTLREVAPEVADTVEPYYRKVIDTGMPILEVEIRGKIVASADHASDYLVSYYPIMDFAGHVRAVSTVVQNITIRKQTENALRESERMLSTLLGNLPGMAYRGLNDPAWTLTFVSGGCFDLTGYHAVELLHGHRVTFADLIHPDDRDSVWQDVQKALATNSSFRLVYRIRTAKGEEKWVWEQGVGIFSKNGELLALEGFIADITERMLAEHALQRAYDQQEVMVVRRTAALTNANEELSKEIAVREHAEQALRRTQFVMDHASEAIFWVQDDGQFFDVNSAACHSVQYSTTELCHMHVWDIDLDFPTDPWSEAWRSFKQKKSITFESRHRKKNGKTFPVEVTANFLEFEKTEFMCAFVRDISERTSTQRALRESEALLHAVLDNTQAVIYLKAVDGHFLLINRRFEELFNISRETIVGQTDYDIFPKEIADALMENDQKVIASKAPMEVEESVPQDNSIHRYLSLKFPVFDDAGEIYAVCGISADITLRNKAAVDLQQAKESAEMANRAKSIFLANMSHEIRTPITALLAAAELLPFCAANEAVHHERIDIILRNGRHLLALIDDLLEQSRLEAGTLKITKQRCSLPELLADIQAVVSPYRQVHGVQFSVSCTVPLPSQVYTDPTRFRQAIVNLCDNAFKHTSKGFVRITLRTTLEQGRVYLIVEVADSGVGIPPSELDRIFEQFSQIEESQAKGTQGVGLGLSIVKWIADQLGGQISVQSEISVGSVFTFTLDVGAANDMDWLEPDQVLGNTSPSTGPIPPDHVTIKIKGLILLADDYEDSRNLMAAALSEAGATVISVADGQQAIEATLRDSFDLILMDVRMPVVDGITATQQIRKQGCLAPIIALTASTLENRQDEILQAGFDDYWLKPMPMAALLSTAEAYLPANQADSADISLDKGLSRKHRNQSIKDKLRKIRQEFSATIHPKVQAIVGSIRSRDHVRATDQLHQFIGAAGLHGHSQLSKLAAKLHAHLKSDPEVTPETLIKEFEIEAARAESSDV